VGQLFITVVIFLFVFTTTKCYSKDMVGTLRDTLQIQIHPKESTGIFFSKICVKIVQNVLCFDTFPHKFSLTILALIFF